MRSTSIIMSDVLTLQQVSPFGKRWEERARAGYSSNDPSQHIGERFTFSFEKVFPLCRLSTPATRRPRVSCLVRFGDPGVTVARRGIEIRIAVDTEGKGRLHQRRSGAKDKDKYRQDYRSQLHIANGSVRRAVPRRAARSRYDREKVERRREKRE